jgi:TP53 regulating kinase and related kinases
VKERFRKTYRHPTLDAKLTERRVTQVCFNTIWLLCLKLKDIDLLLPIKEARCLFKCRNVGIDAPVVYFVDLENSTIYMEYIEGKTVNELLANDATIAEEESGEGRAHCSIISVACGI